MHDMTVVINVAWMHSALKHSDQIYGTPIEFTYLYIMKFFEMRTFSWFLIQTFTIIWLCGILSTSKANTHTILSLYFVYQFWLDW